ncbi:hypothetical protein SSS_01671 [Sarcoptes scabiei]|nr:hypothetical protein SSS_01671 [Sarcoptes scabiei]
MSLAKEKYGFCSEQSLGLLFWHDYHLECALADLPNYYPIPDEWSIEDKALFDQAYQFHHKNFAKIQQLLPHKNLSSIIKYYYAHYKKSKSRSFVEKQVRNKANQQMKDCVDSKESNGMIENEYNLEPDFHQSSSGTVSNQLSVRDPSQIRKECVQCSNKSSSQFFNTKIGLLCKICYNKCKNNKSIDDDVDYDDYDQEGGDEASCEDEQSRMSQSNREPNCLSNLFYDISLGEIAQELQDRSANKILESYDHEIDNLKMKIRKLKQENGEKISLLDKSIDLSLLNQNNNRIISRWTNEETLLMTHAIRDYGKDYKMIAEIIGTKTEQQIKNYFLQNQDKMKLSSLVEELNEENEIVETTLTNTSEIDDKNNRTIKASNTVPANTNR